MIKLLMERPSFDTVKSSTADVVLPSGGKKKQWYIEGIFAQADIKNRNGRRYPKDILFDQVDKYREVYIKENRALGECGHPESPTINPDRVSHIITKLEPDGLDVYGKARILERMPMGNLAAILLDEGVKLGVSTRGVGSTDNELEEGCEIVKEDFFLAAIDLVHDPSAPDGFVRGIMEGKKFLMREGKEFDNDRIKKIIEATNRRNRDEIFLRVFQSYVSMLK